MEKRYEKGRPRSEAAELPEGMIEGRNAVTEALKSGRTIDKLYIASGDTDKALARLAAQAKEAGAVVVQVDRRKLNELSPTGAHQGVIASVAAHEYASIDELLELQVFFRRLGQGEILVDIAGVTAAQSQKNGETQRERRRPWGSFHVRTPVSI